MSKKVLAIKISLTVLLLVGLVGMFFLVGNNPGLVGFERVLVLGASGFGALMIAQIIWLKEALGLIAGLLDD